MQSLLEESEQQINIATDIVLKSRYQQIELTKFGVSLFEEKYPAISTKGLKVVIQFTMTYLWERIFSLYMSRKSKFKKWHNIGADLQLQHL